MMTRLSFTSAPSILIAFAALATPAAATAADWTPDGTQHWLVVAHNLNAAANAGTDEMDAACKGVTLMGGGSEIRNETSQVAKWAVNAHFQICVAYQAVASRAHGKGFMKSGSPCKGLGTAMDELAKAKSGADPDEVVAAAGQLRTTLASLTGDMKDAKTCKFAHVGPF